MKDIIINLQKIRYVENSVNFILINFISSKNVEEERVMPSRSDNIEFLPYDNSNEVVDEIFESHYSRYQNGLETSIRRSNFIFTSVQLLYGGLL